MTKMRKIGISSIFLAVAFIILNITMFSVIAQKIERIQTKLVKAHQINIDGLIEDKEWGNAIPNYLNQEKQVVTGKRKWGGLDDLSATIWVMWDEGNLYLAAVVRDDFPLVHHYEGTDLYRGDSIELYIGFQPEESGISYSPYDFQLGFAPVDKSDEPASWIWSQTSRGGVRDAPVTGVEIGVGKTEFPGYSLEVKIPLINFGEIVLKAPHRVRFDLAVNDADSTFRETQLVWNMTNDGWCFPNVWGEAIITETAEAEEILIIDAPTETLLGKIEIRVLKGLEGLEGATVTIDGKKHVSDVEGLVECFFDREGIFNVTVESKDGKKASKQIMVVRYPRVSAEDIILPVKVNQVGYFPEGQKLAFVSNESSIIIDPSSTFEVIDTKTGEVVYTGQLEKIGKDLVSPIYTADFSELRAPGTYQLRVLSLPEEYPFTVSEDELRGIGHPLSPQYSFPFRVSSNIYNDVYYKTMRSYYLQRCGQEIDDSVSGLKHHACHTEDALLRIDEKTHLDTTGGWHDAGDYGKYTQTAAVTVGQLLMFYELYPQKFTQSLDIPESGNKIPDVLSEIRYELEWMLKMQREDGAVYHKVNTKGFPGFIRPEDDMDQRYIYSIATPDTGSFAAAMAQAARVYEEYDQNFASRCKQAAEKAWGFLEGSEPLVEPTNDSTGEYKDLLDRDNRFWAAAELFKLTKQKKYDDFVQSNFEKFNMPTIGIYPVAPIGWKDVHTLGMFAYYFTEGGDMATKNKIDDFILEQAEKTVDKIKRDPYNISLEMSEYIWASNKNALQYGINLIIAYRINNNSEYLQGALDQLHYVLGRNPLSKSYVTGVGANYPRHPHHRLIMATGVMVEGLLMGGPNNNAESGAAPKNQGPRSYIDSQDSYATNEYAIDYNVPLICLSAYFSGNYW
ncbi:MAG: glycoside hydrolase family 9 protein [Candidatus Atribacteria bacterium]